MRQTLKVGPIPLVHELVKPTFDSGTAAFSACILLGTSHHIQIMEYYHRPCPAVIFRTQRLGLVAVTRYAAISLIERVSKANWRPYIVYKPRRSHHGTASNITNGHTVSGLSIY